MFGHHIVEYDSSYLALNAGNIGFVNHYFFHKISKTGDSLKLWTLLGDTNAHSYTREQQQYSNNINSKIISGASIDTVNRKIVGVISRFNNDYTKVLNFKNCSLASHTEISHFIDHDSVYLFVTYNKNSSAERYSHLVKMDTNGTIIWTKQFRNFSPLKDIKITSVTILPDNEYLLSAIACDYQMYYGQQQDSTFSLLIKLDSNRNELWRIRLGDMKTRNLIANPIVLDDGNFLVSWTDQEFNKLNHQGFIRYNDSSTIHLSKIDMNGNVIWEKDIHDFIAKNDTAMELFHPDEYYPFNLWQIRKLQNGKIAIIGNNFIQGFMLTLDQQGKPFWYRTYYPPSQQPLVINENSENGIRGMIETSDGGYLLTGRSWYSGWNVPSWGRNSGFIYKTDQYGCITKDCHKQDQWYIDSFQIKEPKLETVNPNVYDTIKNKDTLINSGSLLIYPNPSNGEITIALPNSIDLNTPVDVTFYSSNGKLIKEIQLTEMITNLSLKDISKGIYFVKFKSDSFYESKKLIIY